MPRLWLTRTGEGGFALTDCIKAGVVALRYQTVGDATELNVTDIAAGVRLAGTRTNLIAVAGMLFEFVHDVRHGDLIVTTHLASRTVYFGEVTGDYQFSDPSPVPGLLHYRPVAWWGSLDRDTGISADRLRDIDRQPTFYKLPNQAHWLERAHQARTSTAKVVAPGRSRPPPAGQDGSSSRKRAETPSQVCDTCGLRKPAAIIASGICADCQ